MTFLLGTEGVFYNENLNRPQSTVCNISKDVCSTDNLNYLVKLSGLELIRDYTHYVMYILLDFVFVPETTYDCLPSLKRTFRNT